MGTSKQISLTNDLVGLHPNLQERIEKRRERQKAKIAVARHMAEIVWHMFTNMEEYRMKNDEMTKRKYKLMERVSRTT